MSYNYAPPTEAKIIEWDGNPTGRKALDFGAEVKYVNISPDPVFMTPESINRMVLYSYNPSGIREDDIGLDTLTIVDDELNGVRIQTIFSLEDAMVMICGADTTTDEGVFFPKGVNVYYLEIENIVGYIKRLEVETVRECSSLSYHEAYPEFIEHLKNRKYDAPTTTKKSS